MQKHQRGEQRRAHTDDSLSTKPQPAAIVEKPSAQQATRSSTSATASTTEDIDANDRESIECLVEYVNDTFHDLKQEEMRFFLLQDRTTNAQSDLTSKLRTRTVDWLFSVRRDFRLRYETVFGAISVLDRYLYSTSSLHRQQQLSSTSTTASSNNNVVTNNNVVKRNELRECACAALLLASTLEESYPPDMIDLQHAVHHSCSAAEIQARSWRMAGALQFALWSPNALHFLRRYSKAARSSGPQHSLAKLYCQIAQLPYHSLVGAYLPSQLAAAATLLAVFTCSKETNNNAAADVAQERRRLQRPWSRTLVHYTGYQLVELACCAATMWLWLKHILNDCNNKSHILAEYAANQNVQTIEENDLLPPAHMLQRHVLPLLDPLSHLASIVASHTEGGVVDQQLCTKQRAQFFALL